MSRLMMPRLWLWLSLLITVFFAIVALLIRAQPYDDVALRTFLTPPQNCAAPCFMGIQAGIIRVSAGESYLRASPQIQSVKLISFQLYEVQFSESAPTQWARVYFMALPDVTIERVNLFDNGIAFNRFFLTFGTPERLMVYDTISHNVVSLVAFYPHYGLSIVTNLSLCALRQSNLWDNKRDVAIDVGSWRADAKKSDYYLSPIELNVGYWAKQLRDIRREHCS
ncbi:MAG: hypothetical protein ABI690_03840 [Chloroflexota bacterium]